MTCGALVSISMLLLTLGQIDTRAGYSGGPGIADAEEIESERDIFSCGHWALYILCRLEGRPVDLATVAARLSGGSAAGHSLAQIRAAAASCGLRLRGVRLGPGDWPLDRPALIHLDRHASGHFVVIRPIGHTGKLVQVIDGPHRVEVLDFDRLTSSPEWTGRALVPRRPNWVGGAGVGVAVGASGSILIYASRRLRYRRRAADRRPITTPEAIAAASARGTGATS